jgi:hypothetical protein
MRTGETATGLGPGLKYAHPFPARAEEPGAAQAGDAGTDDDGVSHGRYSTRPVELATSPRQVVILAKGMRHGHLSGKTTHFRDARQKGPGSKAGPHLFFNASFL